VTVVVAGSASGALAAGKAPRAAAATIDYWFHGVPQDDMNRAASFGNEMPPPPDSMTFNTSSAFDAVPVTQTMGNPNADFVPNPLAVWWTGPFTGTLNGTITFDWFWQTSNVSGIALGVDVNIKVVADPDFANPGVGTQTIIGNFSTTFSFVDTTPVRFITEVPVSGTVANRLLIQVATQFVDTGPGLKTLYDHAMFPSKFTVPTTPTAVNVSSFTAKARRATRGASLWRWQARAEAVGPDAWRRAARPRVTASR
jgi:hypothetical protein